MGRTTKRAKSGVEPASFVTVWNTTDPDGDVHVLDRNDEHILCDHATFDSENGAWMPGFRLQYPSTEFPISSGERELCDVCGEHVERA